MTTTPLNKAAELVAVSASARWHKDHATVAVIGYYGAQSNAIPETLLEAMVPWNELVYETAGERLINVAGDALVVVYKRLLAP